MRSKVRRVGPRGARKTISTNWIGRHQVRHPRTKERSTDSAAGGGCRGGRGCTTWRGVSLRAGPQTNGIWPCERSGNKRWRAHCRGAIRVCVRSVAWKSLPGRPWRANLYFTAGSVLLWCSGRRYAVCTSGAADLAVSGRPGLWNAGHRGAEIVRKYVARRFPALRDAPIVETRVCQYENTSNGDFLIDRHPEMENVWFAGGGSGHGFKHGPAIGEYVTGQLLDGSAAEERFSLETKDTVQRRAVY